MTPAKLIASRRKALGLAESDVAAKAGLSVHEYWDVEHHDDELFTVADLSQVRRLVRALGLSVDDVLAAAGVPFSRETAEVPAHERSRSELIRLRREAIGLSTEELADTLGYETDAVDALENDPQFLENWSLELIAKLAQVLQIPVHRLLLEA